MRYTYRKNKAKYCYHISTGSGTVCKLENGCAGGKLDVLTTEPPIDRRLCSICAQLSGIAVTKPPACASIFPHPTATPTPPVRPAPQLPPATGKPDSLLAHFGVTSSISDADHEEVTLALVRQMVSEKYGVNMPKLNYSHARHFLKRTKQGLIPKGLGISKTKLRAAQPKVIKPPKPKKVKSNLSPERVAWIISDDFLRSWEWRKLRYEALKRSDGRCEACGRGKTDGVVLHVDHIKSRRLHPELALLLENLQILDADCNAGKGFKDATNWRDKNALRSAGHAEADATIPWERFDSF